MTNKQATFSLLFLLLFIVAAVHAQDVKTADIRFRLPLNIPIYLSGTFGELRPNHFHSGIDIKTQGVEGKPVYAIENGYVSRIKVSTGGYGKVLYITHPNGYVSVYGHLQRFNDCLEQFVRTLQYRKERFSVEAYPEKGKLKIRKGQLIAFTGNTGGSNGPHLHFEIREEATQYPVNPLFFDSIVIRDKVRPSIAELGVYPVGEQTLINGKNDTAFFRVEKNGGHFSLLPNKSISVSGSFSLGIRIYDQMNEISNKNGVYSVKLMLDGEQVFGLEMNRLSFSTTRYLNSLIDYNYYKLKKRRLIRTQVDTNNRLFNYREVSNNGIFSFTDTLVHDFRFEVSDVYGNRSDFSFRVQAQKQLAVPRMNDNMPDKGIFFKFDRENAISCGSVSLKFPANAFYRSFYFRLDSLPSDEEEYAPVFRVHNRFTPVQKYFTIAIAPDTVPVAIKNKMYIALIDNEGRSYFIGGKWNARTLSAKSWQLGDYTVKADTVKPEIKPLNFSNGKKLSGQNTLKLSIQEKQTGIKSYRGTLNGHWILMEYEPKKNRLTYTFDEYLKKGENTFKLVVKDLLDNEAVYEAVVVY